MRNLALGLALSTGIPAALPAQTVQEMMEVCSSVGQLGAVPDHNGYMCMGTANGIAQVLALGCGAAGAGTSLPPLFKGAMPPSPAAAVQAFLSQARQQPERWGEHFSLLFVETLSKTFPCEN